MSRDYIDIGTDSYDPAGRLHRITAGGVNSRFAYAGAQAIGEYDSSGALISRYVPGAGLDDYAAYTTGTGTGITRQWPVADPLGSVVGITNGSSAATQINTYDEYGVPGASFSGRFGYAGSMSLNRGMAAPWFMRNRQYNPTLGRFMQTDPIGINGGVNLYAYVGNDPVNMVDPWGLGPSFRVGCTRSDVPNQRPRPPTLWSCRTVSSGFLGGLNRGGGIIRAGGGGGGGQDGDHPSCRRNGTMLRDEARQLANGIFRRDGFYLAITSVELVLFIGRGDYFGYAVERRNGRIVEEFYFFPMYGDLTGLNLEGGFQSLYSTGSPIGTQTGLLFIDIPLVSIGMGDDFSIGLDLTLPIGGGAVMGDFTGVRATCLRPAG